MNRNTMAATGTVRRFLDRLTFSLKWDEVVLSSPTHIKIENSCNLTLVFDPASGQWRLDTGTLNLTSADAKIALWEQVPQISNTRYPIGENKPTVEDSGVAVPCQSETEGEFATVSGPSSLKKRKVTKSK